MKLHKTLYASNNLQELLNLADQDKGLSELGKELMYRLEALQEATGGGNAERLTNQH